MFHNPCLISFVPISNFKFRSFV